MNFKLYKLATNEASCQSRECQGTSGRAFLNPVTRWRSKHLAKIPRYAPAIIVYMGCDSLYSIVSGYNYCSSGRQPQQQQWKFQQHWKQRQLVVVYGQLNNKRLEPEIELQ
jgi:hypothetical protein